MFDARAEAVNLSTPIESTIRWLRERSPALPLRYRLSWWWVPARCACCGQRGDLGAIDLCAACLAEFPFRPPPEAPADPALPLVAFAYEDPVGSGLRALKYRGDLRPARLLGTLLAAHAAQSRAALPQLLVPVPLHPSRLGERGFNQSEQLARHAAAWLALPAAERMQTFQAKPLWQRAIIIAAGPAVSSSPNTSAISGSSLRLAIAASILALYSGSCIAPIICCMLGSA